MIQSHLYAKNSDTPLFTEREKNSIPLCLLGQGTWLGVIDVQDGWFHVIGIQYQGWVKSEDVEPLDPFKLHIQWSPGQPIQYVGSAA